MVELTTVKVSKATLRWLVSFKGSLESEIGQRISMDFAILSAVSHYDWERQVKKGLTRLAEMEFFNQRFDRFATADERQEKAALIEEMEAYGLLR